MLNVWYGMISSCYKRGSMLKNKISWKNFIGPFYIRFILIHCPDIFLNMYDSKKLILLRLLLLRWSTGVPIGLLLLWVLFIIDYFVLWWTTFGFTENETHYPGILYLWLLLKTTQNNWELHSSGWRYM